MPPEMITVTEMDRRMDNDLDTFALNIPANFQRDLLAGRWYVSVYTTAYPSGELRGQLRVVN